MPKEKFLQILGESRAVAEEYRRGRGGINYVHSLVNMEPSSSIKGEITRSKGFKEIYDTKIDSPMQNIAFAKDSNSVLKFIGICNKKVIDIANWKTTTPSHSVKGSVTNLGYVDIIPCSDKNLGEILVLLDGDYPNYYNFTSVAQLHTNHKSTFGLFTNGRLWSNKIDEKGLIWGSAPDDTADYDVLHFAGFLLFGSNFDAATAMSTIFIPFDNSTHIVVAKKNEMYAISGNSFDLENSSTPFLPYTLNLGGAGTLSPRGLIQVDQEVFILGETDIKQYSSIVSDNGVLKPKDSSEAERSIYRDNINPAFMADSFMFYNQYDGRDGRIYSFVPTIEAGKCNYAFCLDRMTAGWFRRDFHYFNFTCYAVDPSTNKMYLGSSDGKIYEFNPEAYYSYNGNGYSSFVDYGFVDFGLPSATKTISPSSWIDIETSGATNVDLTIIKKNENGYVKPSKINLTVNPLQGLYDSSKYDETLYNAKLSARKKLDLKGSFEEIAVQLKIFEPDVNIIIKGMELEAQSSGSN